LIRQAVKDDGTVDTGKTNGTAANAFIGMSIDGRLGAAENYYVDIGIGSALFNDVTLLGAASAPAVGFFRLRSNVSANGFQLGKYVSNVGRNLLITDGRAVPSVASAAGNIALPLGEFISVTGTAAITSITATYFGDVVTLIFASTASLTDGSNLKLSANFTGSAGRTITLRCDGSDWYEISRTST
jgi:hypothetical protein